MTREEAIAFGKRVIDLGFNGETHEFCKMAIEALEQKPKTGRWIEIAQYSDAKHKIECSECGNHIIDRGHANSFNVKNKYKYCPNCGCRMESKDEVEK